jgi:GGDEF domain-containing protein
VRVALLAAPIWLLLVWSALQFEGRWLAFGVAAGAVLFYCAQALAAGVEAEAAFRARAVRLQAVVEHRLGRLDFSDAGMSRRYIETRLEQEIRRSQRYKLPLTVVLMRTWAREADWVQWQEEAAEVMAVASEILRTEDIFGHLSGPEFAIILPHTPRTQADVVIQRLGQSLAEHAPRFGVAQLGESEPGVAELLQAAREDLEAEAGSRAA